jgi:hypothetical protein
MQALTRDDVPVTISNDDVDVRTSEVGDMTVSFIQLRKGTDLGPALVGLPGDLCQCPHWGYMLSGRLKMRTDHGDSTYEAGQAFYWAPGHAPVALEDCAYVDFSPTDEFSPVLEHLSGG